jgi:peptide-methionine (S)-S-oxide reductase
VVQVEYDPSVVSCEELLAAFWSSHDPTTLNRQGLDVGTQYRSVVFFHNKDQKRAAKAAKEKLQDRVGKRKIATKISPASKFWRAEEYHQKYYAKCGMTRMHL